MISVGEPELIRDITIKDFNKFVDRGNVSFGDPLFDRSLLTAKGEDWKRLRTIVSNVLIFFSIQLILNFY